MVELDLALKRPHRDGTHPILGQRSGLVGADHVCGSERLHRAEALDERSPARQGAHGDSQGERDDRQQALGDVPGQQADREHDAVLNESPAPRIATGTKATAIVTAMAAISQATRRTCASSGLGSSFTRSDSAAMRPSSVCIPVANTTPRASPPVALVPLKRRSRAAIRGTSTSTSAAERSAGADSPLSVERSTSTAPEIMRMSAAMRSPSSTTTTSPGTRSAARIDDRSPSRSTVTRAAGTARAPPPRALPASPARTRTER